jgi:hypothetical protein
LSPERSEICPSCREDIKTDWEVCPRCGAILIEFDGAREPVGRPEEPRGPAVIAAKPADGEMPGAPRPGPLCAEPLVPGAIPSSDVPYTLMRLGTDAIDVAELGLRLCAILGRPRAELTCLMRTSKGFLARGVSQERLADIANVLAELDVQAAAVPEEQIAGLPPVYRTAEVHADADKLACIATSAEGQAWEIEFAPEEVALVVTGRVMYTARITHERRKYDPYHNIPLLKKRYRSNEDAVRRVSQEIHGHDYLIYVFLPSPERALLITDVSVNYRLMERLPSDPQKMKRQAGRLLDALPEGVHDAGLSLLADLLEEDASRWRPLTFATHRSFEAYAQWRYNLRRVRRDG